MPAVVLDDLASVGLIRDVESYLLPPEAWTTASNIRFRDGGAERRGGRSQVFGTPGVAPHFALPVSNASQTWWLYTSLLKAYVFDGTNHVDITRVSGDYTASATRDWNGTLFGGVPILNNGVDVPQFWAAYSTGTKLAPLTNWTSTARAKVLRSFGPQLIALHLTDSGTVKPHLVRWSHPADPGTVPASWDITDATKDAGESDLPDVHAGLIRDGLPLRGNFYIYKDGSTWRMTYVGGVYKFSFQVFSETSGILAPRCVTLTADGGQHVVATQDDIVFHNGNAAPQSLITGRMRRSLFNSIDNDNYLNSFMFTNPFSNEIWFCYPESGQTNPNKALVWAYKEGQFGALSEKDVNFRNAAHGVIESASDETWATASGDWDSDSEQWSQATRRKVVLCGTDATKFYQLDDGITDAGSTISATLQRIGLSVVGRDRKGAWITDFQARKFVTRVWVTASGGPIDVRIGYANTVDGAVAWSATKSFDPATQKWIDIAISGVAIAIEFSASVHFRVSSYKLELDVIGEY